MSNSIESSYKAKRRKETMIAYCEGFVIAIDKQLPPAILLTAYELPKYGQRSIKNRPMITASNDEALPELFTKAIEAGLIDPGTYEEEKLRLLKNHGLKI